MDRSSRFLSGTFELTSILPPMCRRKVRSLTLYTAAPSPAPAACSSSWEWSASLAEHVTSRTSRSRVESTTSIAVTTPPAEAMAGATAPTTPWSGAVCSRMVIEYDDAVALTTSPSGLGVRTASSGFLGAQVLQQVRREAVPHGVD